MTQKNFFLTAAFVFTLASLLHLIRAFSGWELVINSYSVPLWVSWLVFLIAGCLAWQAWKFGSACKK